MTTISIDNHRKNQQLYALLTANSMFPPDPKEPGALVPGACQPLTQNSKICFDTIDAARLYIATSPMTAAPQVTDITHYFGWVEFSRLSAKDELWINLSNVDMLGLPLALSGTQNHMPKSLGYKLPMQANPDQLPASGAKSLINALEPLFVGVAPPVIGLADGGKKVVAPNIWPQAYPSFAPYVEKLSLAHGGDGVPLLIKSDMVAQEQLIFKGKLQEPASNDGMLIAMHDQNGNKLEIARSQLETKYIYQSGGGTYHYNNQLFAQNIQVIKGSPSETRDIMLNSVLRNIFLGFNEGYFSRNGPNDSSNFVKQKPFENGGNGYAKVIHENSNSYGYPYADANLKTQLVANPELATTIHILGDQETGYYTAP
ncbi:hypothetical protein [Polycladidibacter stylochi]|uniref:hypothetical protein n=1 Tax=Polycladidibacter stylochi TaxID=1807766 RepID=UPI000829E3FB|nr:hypothetical protein [Pseudovibrio stylochi]